MPRESEELLLDYTESGMELDGKHAKSADSTSDMNALSLEHESPAPVFARL